MIINNRFSSDDDNVRSERLVLLSANIDTFAVELGYAGARLAWAQGASAAWETARTATGVEKGEMNDAFEDFHKYVIDCSKFYSAAKEMLQNIIWEYGGKPDDFIERYGLKGATPAKFRALMVKYNEWLSQDAKLRAAGDPRIVPLAITDQITARRDQMDMMFDVANTEQNESTAAFETKFDIFDADTYQLNILLNAAKLVWGDDDHRLRLLGLCPSSEIWTPGDPEPGQAEWPEAVANFVAVFMTFPMPLFNLSWDLLLKAMTYNLYRTKAPLGNPDKNRPVDPVETGLTEPLLTDTNIEQGNVYVYWLCGVDENGVEGEFGEPLVMEYV